ncbi:MAG: hypothetical protein H7338_11140 [Candidatus Sericytochromatia bacterium]|nr:hypothetical protein [Candidatus Sericytochromatia bacterium]
MHYDADRSSNVHLSQGSLRTPTGGDHETITQGYVRLIRHFLATTDRHRPFAAISAGLIATYGGKQTLLSHYSPEHLTSWAARTG